MDDSQKTLSDIQNEAIQLVKGEVTKYKDGEWFITENVSIATRPLIRLLRKNYWGIFDAPNDPVTNRKKTWVPLTRLIVDSARKLSDIDLKDLTFAALRRKAIGIVSIVRGYVRYWLRINFFGEVLDESILQMCIDGTAIWKTYAIKENGKTCVKRRSVDILNVFLDPTANSIQEAQRFTERALMSTIDIESMTGWKNTSNIRTAANLHRTEIDVTNADSSGDFVDVYEMWGLIPKRFVTGNKDDKGTVNGHVVVSGIETGDIRVHLIEENTNKDKAGNIVKPYEEMRYMKVPGRWAGVGPAEMVLHLQEWINTIVNLRINKNTNASLGLFKIRAGANVTQQMLSNLVSRGVIKLNDMEDLENLRVDEAGEGSYRDEEIAKDWAFNVTSTYDIARGENTGPSTATASAIEDRNSKTAFTLVIEAVGHMLGRWMDRQFLPHVPKMIKEQKDITIFGDFDEIDKLRQDVVAYLAMEEMEKQYRETGYVPTKEELDMAMQQAEADLRKDKDLFIEMVEDVVVENLETIAQFTNETTDTTVTVRNLLDMAGLIEDPEARNDFFMQSMDLMGLEIPESLRKPPMPPMDPNAPQGGALPGLPPMPEMPPMGAPAMPPMGVPTQQGLTTAANTL
jgi:hypothetical protein